MTGNKSYLSDYEEIDGGFVAFGGDSKGGKITSKDTECVVLSLNSKLLDENYVLLRVPRKDNMYSVDLKNIVPSGGLNFKTMNKLVRGNLVRGLPSKIFENSHTCVACQKGKQHKASFNAACAQLQLLSDYYCWKDYADRDEINDLSEKR
ncbi:hypothetical protein Tco_1132169 [Tanacetum coccineum]|uniref:GAG-pre-integrase domain-containing protein n=1 Tax=Tanacetum coccineum TaxID=301880 RepID=A0ABQ5JB83_9ASTR